ncbi:MAG: hypothetical protein ACE5PO_06340 [Candidatus Bathyarchaeia archaeon]
MTEVDKDTLERIARRIYGVDISDAQLDKLAKMVQTGLEALEKSARVGIGDVEPRVTYDPSGE